MIHVDFLLQDQYVFAVWSFLASAPDIYCICVFDCLTNEYTLSFVETTPQESIFASLLVLSEYQWPLKLSKGLPKFIWQKSIDNDMRLIEVNF